MVIDRLQNANLYYGLGQRFRTALKWLSTVNPDTLVSGQRVEIDGDNVYGIMFDVDTLPPEQCKLEGHQNYADVQCLVAGLEGAGYLLDGQIAELEPYDPQKDIGFYTGDWDTLTIRPGMFYIVWPHDLHAPRIALGKPTPVRRLVVKVKL